MGFLAPWFLAGIVAVGVPLWLHLLRRYRSEPQPFSSLMFFEPRTQSSILHRRLRYLVLLALRVALLALMALAFANPFVNQTAVLAGGKKLVVIAVDRSFSMRYGDRMERANDEAKKVVASMRGGELGQIAAVDSGVQLLTQPTNDPSELRAAIDTIVAGDRASGFGEFTRALRALAQTPGVRLDVHFIGDFQKTSMPPAFADLQPGPRVSLTLTSVGGAAPNWAVESVTAPLHVQDPKKVRVTATVAGWNTGATTRGATLVLDGRVVGTKSMTVPANGRAQVEFTGFDVGYGAHHCEVRIEPHDSLAADDAFPFVIERSDPRRVLLLEDAGRGRAGFYYRAALDSVTDVGLTAEALPASEASTLDFSKYAFVVLSDVGTLPRDVEASLRDYVNRGGALLTLVGPASAARNQIPITNDRFAERTNPLRAGQTDRSHPALQSAGQFDGVEFSRTARIEPAPGARVLAKFSDGSPLLLEENIGEGRVLTFASTFDNVSNDLPLHASFVPFVAESARYLSGEEDSASSIPVGTRVELRRGKEARTAVNVIGPDGKREMTLTEATTAMNFEPQRDGFYEVQRADGRRLLVAAHADRRESDLTPIPADTLALWHNLGNQQDSPATGESRETKPRSLWRYALILVLLAAIAESLVASRYLRGERQTA